MSPFNIPEDSFVPHFKVRQQDAIYEVQRVDTYSFNELLQVSKSESIIRFPSLSSLFRSLLYDWPLREGYAQTKEFEDYIVKIFFNKYLPPSETIALLKQFLRNNNPTLTFAYQQIIDDIREIISNEHKIALVGTHSTSCPPDELKSFEDYLQVCSMYDIRVPDYTHWLFNSDVEFFFWILEQVINSNYAIHTCGCCGKYFIPNHLGAKYCSSSCSYVAQSQSRFCGDKEIEKLYHRVYQALKRKTRSEQEYLYYRPKFSGDFQDLALLKKCPIPKNKDIDSYHFNKNDFLIIFQAFKDENKKQYSGFQKMSEELNNHLVSFKDFSEDRKYYLDWLANFKTLISAFKVTHTRICQ